MVFWGKHPEKHLQLIGGHPPAVSQKIIYSQVDPYFSMNLLLIV